MSGFVVTPSQTVGPFFAIGLEHLCRRDVPEVASGAETVEVTGRILDGEGVPVPDAFLEIWQANASGRYGSEGDLFDLPAGLGEGWAVFPGFARVATEADGGFRFTIVQPGGVAYDQDRVQAPHLLILVFMRGLLRHLVTRMYFPDAATASDPVLALVPEARRGTLIATEASAGRLIWDIRLRGAGETVFFLC